MSHTLTLHNSEYTFKSTIHSTLEANNCPLLLHHNQYDHHFHHHRLH